MDHFHFSWENGDNCPSCGVGKECLKRFIKIKINKFKKKQFYVPESLGGTGDSFEDVGLLFIPLAELVIVGNPLDGGGACAVKFCGGGGACEATPDWAKSNIRTT